MAKSRKKADIPDGETKYQRFVRVANGRLVKAYIAIEMIGKLSGASYDWTEEDIAHIHNVLRGVLDRELKRFEPQSDNKRRSDVPLLSAGTISS